MPIDPKSLPEDPKILQQILIDLTAQRDKRSVCCASCWGQERHSSEQITCDQLRFFAQELGTHTAPTAAQENRRGEERFLLFSKVVVTHDTA